MQYSAVALLVGATLGFELSAQTPVPIIAVLEHPQCAKDSTLAVRPLFVKSHGSWTALSTAEKSGVVDLRSMNWTVAFDGRSLGSITTDDPGFTSRNESSYPRDRRLTIRNNVRSPTIANTERAFAGWCSSPLTRPLALISPANVKDPDLWKPFTPGPSVRERLFRDFKKRAGRAVRCPENPTKAVPFKYTAMNIVVGTGYRDRMGRALIALRLDDRMNECDGPTGEAWATQWFLLADGVHPLGRSLELVNAGDYDADGRSEILFWYSGYNEDGYTLFYSDFNRHLDFRWSYH